MAYRACVLQMVYRHLEAEAGGDDEAEANGRARMAEEALLNASVRAHGTHLSAPCRSICLRIAWSHLAPPQWHTLVRELSNSQACFMTGGGAARHDAGHI